MFSKFPNSSHLNQPDLAKSMQDPFLKRLFINPTPTGYLPPPQFQGMANPANMRKWFAQGEKFMNSMDWMKLADSPENLFSLQKYWLSPIASSQGDSQRPLPQKRRPVPVSKEKGSVQDRSTRLSKPKLYLQ